MEQPEKSVPNLSVLRQISGVSAIIAVALTAASVVVIPEGGSGAFVVVALMLFLWLLAISTFVLQHRQSAAEMAIQRQYAQMSAHEAEKPKRKNTVHLTDDGELSDDEPFTELDHQHAARH